MVRHDLFENTPPTAGTSPSVTVPAGSIGTVRLQFQSPAGKNRPGGMTTIYEVVFWGYAGELAHLHRDQFDVIEEEPQASRKARE
jgi:hypothetical protein